MATFQAISTDLAIPTAPKDEASELLDGKPMGYIEGHKLDSRKFYAAAPFRDALRAAPRGRLIIFEHQPRPEPGDVVFAYLTLRRRGTPEHEDEAAKLGWVDDLTVWERRVIRRLERTSEGKIRLVADGAEFQSWTQGPIGDDLMLEITITGRATDYTALLKLGSFVYFTMSSEGRRSVSLPAAKENAKLFAASSWDGVFTCDRNGQNFSSKPETHFGLKVLDRAMWGLASADVVARTVAVHAERVPKVGDVFLAMDDRDRLHLLRVGSHGYTTMAHEPAAGSVTSLGVIWGVFDRFVVDAASQNAEAELEAA